MTEDRAAQREDEYAKREELSRARAIVDHQTAEIERLEKRHAALVAAAREVVDDWESCDTDVSRVGGNMRALRAALASEEAERG